MPPNKVKIKYRYLFDIENGVLHDLKSKRNPTNQGCGLDDVENWVCFDTQNEPHEGITIKKLTKTKELVDIEVRELCQHCMSLQDQNLADMLKSYFLEKS